MVGRGAILSAELCALLVTRPGRTDLMLGTVAILPAVSVKHFLSWGRKAPRSLLHGAGRKQRQQVWTFEKIGYGGRMVQRNGPLEGKGYSPEGGLGFCDKACLCAERNDPGGKEVGDVPAGWTHGAKSLRRGAWWGRWTVQERPPLGGGGRADLGPL